MLYCVRPVFLPVIVEMSLSITITVKVAVITVALKISLIVRAFVRCHGRKRMDGVCSTGRPAVGS